MSIAQSAASSPTAGELRRVPLAMIDPGPNDRKLFELDALRTLAESIDREGLVQLPTLRETVGGRYEIVAGERRCRAMRMLGWAETDAIVRPLDDTAASAIMLVENMVRVQLDPIEEATALRRRIDQGATVAEVAKLVGMGQATVRSRLALLELADDARRMVANRTLPVGYAAHMVGLDPDRQHLALRALSEGELSLEGFRAVCARLAAEQQAEPMFDPSTFFSVEVYVCEGQAADKLSEMRGQELLSSADVARVAGITPASLKKYRHRGVFPDPDRYFGREPGWYPATVQAWMESRRKPGQRRQETK